VEGDHRCAGDVLEVCEAGQWTVEEDCGLSGAWCHAELGCIICTPDLVYCDDQLLMRCSPDGKSAELLADCSAIEGAVCNAPAGACISLCDEAARNRSNLGCEYWAVDLDQWYSEDMMNPDATAEQFALVVTNPQSFTVTVTVEVNDAPVGDPPNVVPVGTWDVGPFELVQIDLPQREVDGSVLYQNEGTGTALTSQAFRVTATAPIVAWQFNPIYQMHTNDASILIPTPALDTRYWVLDYQGIGTAANPLSPSSTNYSYLTIVGTEDGTEVSVTVTADVGPGGPVTEWTPAGSTITASLNAFDVFNLEAHCPPEMGPLVCMSDGLTDFSGTLITSTAPVAVFSGAECTNVVPPSCTGDSCCCDHLEDQIFPAVALGRNYVAPHSPSRGGTEEDLWRILADRDDTLVETNMPAPYDSFTLGSGEFVEFFSRQSFTITASRPVLIGQYLVSQGCTSAHTGDPAFTTFPPVEQYRRSYIFLVPETFDRDACVIVRPEGAEVLLDDLPVPSGVSGCTTAAAGEIDAVAYETISCNLEDGVHRISAEEPVGLLVVGYGPAGSYAFVGGANVERINIPE
jgi:hypothetical protein